MSTATSTLWRDSATPLYVQLADAVEREIADGRLARGARLPSESELIERFGVSRVTVRGAIARLVRSGVVETRQGKGTFVAARVVRQGLDELTGFYDAMVSHGLAPRLNLLDFRAARPDETAGTPFAERAPAPMLLRRLYRVDDKPFAVVQGLLLPDAARLGPGDAATHTIYQLLEALHLVVERADIGIRARPPARDIADCLATAPRRHVLVMERSSYASGGRLLEHTHFFIAPESYEFRLSLLGPVTIGSGIRAVPRRAAARERPLAFAD